MRYTHDKVNGFNTRKGILAARVDIKKHSVRRDGLLYKSDKAVVKKD